jgi:hypothetical protein
MANTKHLGRQERRQAKRGARRKLKETYRSLTPSQKRKFRRSEHTSLRAWLAEQASEEA